MTELIDTQHGVATFLITIAIVMGLNFVATLGHLAWKIWSEKNKMSSRAAQKLAFALEKNTAAIQQLNGEMTKFKGDLRKAFIAIRLLSGDRWEEVRKLIMDELNIG